MLQLSTRATWRGGPRGRGRYRHRRGLVRHSARVRAHRLGWTHGLPIPGGPGRKGTRRGEPKSVKRLRLHRKLSHCAGCAGEARAGDLQKILGLKSSRIWALVGFSVERRRGGPPPSRPGVVETVDFFPPVVDDPFQFSAIAAKRSNAGASDIYAMGAGRCSRSTWWASPTSLPMSPCCRRFSPGLIEGGRGGHPLHPRRPHPGPEPKYGPGRHGEWWTRRRCSITAGRSPATCCS